MKRLRKLKKTPIEEDMCVNWGKPFDYGIIAETSDPARGLVGVAWMRLLTFDNKGAGYVDDQTPELSIGLFKRYRNRGIGKKMMMKLIDDVRGKVDKICLSVRDYNTPAISLYETFGFGIYGTPFKNRVGTLSFKMMLRL